MGRENSGRRPQPTALKILRGNPGKRPLNELEPKPPAGEVEKPALSVGGQAAWKDLAPVCLVMGTLTPADVTAFAAMCELVGTLRATSMSKDTGDFDARLERDTANALRPYFAMFGLEPSGRARLRVAPKEATDHKWADLAG